MSCRKLLPQKKNILNDYIVNTEVCNHINNIQYILENKLLVFRPITYEIEADVNF